MDRGLLRGSKTHVQLRVETTPTLERLLDGWYSTGLVMVWVRGGGHDPKGKIKWLWVWKVKVGSGGRVWFEKSLGETS